MASTPSTSSELVEEFLRNGWVEVPDALDPDYCEERVRAVLAVMGVDEADRSTWPVGWHATAPTEAPPVEAVAPRAADVLHELVGGRTAISFAGIPDNLIFNFPDPTAEWWPPEQWSAEGAGYHKDGDWFRHFLDSPEQGILGIILWRDVTERQGPTYLATDSIGPVARFLRDHPEGIDPGDFAMREILAACRDFRALTGRQGTVVLAHPFMVHSASVNATTDIRVISNTAVMLREPMQLDRPDGRYTPVERLILEGLGVDRYPFTATGSRAKIVSAREKRWRSV
jgi:hypothetical protein